MGRFGRDYAETGAALIEEADLAWSSWLGLALGRAADDAELEEELEPGDTVCFPPGPSGAHKVTNTGENAVRILMLSTMPEVDISYYPDSEKFGVWPGGGAKGFLVRRESEVDYYDGER